ncbi:hypothetical protein OC498_07845 [Acinetobacter bohemicus]|uniref:Uncharacterized protein n=1 Tax=Acinetobacter lwoffii TaxID=28090 RepID=A0A9D2URY3_ACILW|nr:MULTISPECIES: hypothetical protein [Acinetobacter]HJF27584.1 hypothetical protein [Acinetobacter lwoffii]MCO8042454.1 hypothetical protein [Acinetobacter sp. S4400-12]MCU7224814.1 hypothetical protein [Acinetobacter bohemicus]QKQ70010.1 hypothetical protein E5Y90_07095 [Acinetobacter sp. 10FS3-1]TQR64752.1 hypothetical protein E2K52_06695 [Acinetobacter sp. RF14B]
MQKKNIRLVTSADISELSLLINTAYRGQGGWTTESGIIQVTEKTEAYPIDQQVGKPLVQVHLVVLEKLLE